MRRTGPHAIDGSEVAADVWWWGIVNRYQATGFLLAVVGSWVAYLPAVHWTATVIPLISGWSICIRNAFQPMAPTPIEIAEAVVRKEQVVIFWPGLAVYCAGVAAAQVVRVTQDGVPPLFASFFCGLVCALAVLGAGVLFVVVRLSRPRKT